MPKIPPQPSKRSTKKTPPIDDQRERPDDEPVGYGRPPKRTRFQKGQSGNPKGRPRGAPNKSTLRTMVLDLWFEDEIKVIENGRERRVPRVVALLKKQAELALKGDARALRDVLDLLDRSTPDDLEPRVREESVAEDEALLRTHLFGVGGGGTPAEPEGRDDV